MGISSLFKRKKERPSSHLKTLPITDPFFFKVKSGFNAVFGFNNLSELYQFAKDSGGTVTVICQQADNAIFCHEEKEVPVPLTAEYCAKLIGKASSGSDIVFPTDKSVSICTIPQDCIRFKLKDLGKMTFPKVYHSAVKLPQ